MSSNGSPPTPLAGESPGCCAFALRWHSRERTSNRPIGGGRFDLVYTGIGALCWLPDVARWAQVVAALLRPGGRLFMREGHPVLWALADPRPDGLLVLDYPYFETEGVRFAEAFSYVAHDEPLASPDLVHFNRRSNGRIGGQICRWFDGAPNR